jgi:formylglycine-generating enzyme required for sulfatase activity
MLQIFLCHSADDKPAIRQLYTKLRQELYQPWLDEADLIPGQDWAMEIARAVRASDVVVVCLSLTSITKEGFVQKEIKQALDVADEKPEGTIFVVPLRLEDCEVPERLRRWHWVNLFDSDGYEKLLRALRKREQGQRTPAGSFESHSQLDEHIKRDKDQHPVPVKYQAIAESAVLSNAEPEKPSGDENVIQRASSAPEKYGDPANRAAVLIGVAFTILFIMVAVWQLSKSHLADKSEKSTSSPVDQRTVQQGKPSAAEANPITTPSGSSKPENNGSATQLLRLEPTPAIQGTTLSPKKAMKPESSATGNGASDNQSTVGLEPLKQRVNSKDGLRYVWVPSGEFTMGCSPGDGYCGDDEKPPHQVNIKHGFWIGQTEVTVAAWRRFEKIIHPASFRLPQHENGWSQDDSNDNVVFTLVDFPPGYVPSWARFLPSEPVTGVSWTEAKQFCEDYAGQRLPTEAEWEYAARGGSKMARYGDINKVAWFSDNSKHIHEVAKRLPNSFGLYDMLGNAWEWVNDWYGKEYYKLQATRTLENPSGPADGSAKVIRGGSYTNGPQHVRVSFRGRSQVNTAIFNIGFRCVGTLH